jgi:hypothetical protein
MTKELKWGYRSYEPTRHTKNAITSVVTHVLDATDAAKAETLMASVDKVVTGVRTDALLTTIIKDVSTTTSVPTTAQRGTKLVVVGLTAAGHKVTLTVPTAKVSLRLSGSSSIDFTTADTPGQKLAAVLVGSGKIWTDERGNDVTSIESMSIVSRNVN